MHLYLYPFTHSWQASGGDCWWLDSGGSNVADKLEAKQFGGLKGRSTTRALVDSIHRWHAALDSGSSTRVTFVVFAKAFDHVYHNLVVEKLKSFGLSEIITDWITHFIPP